MQWRSLMLAMVSVALVPPAQAGSSETSKYCVKPIEIARVDAGKPFSQSRGPSRLMFANESPTPIATDAVKEPADGDKYFLRTVHWRFAADHRLVGPFNISQYGLRGHDGRIAYFLEKTDVWGLDSGEGDGEREDRIWSLVPDGELTVVEGPWTGNDWQLSIENTPSTFGKMILSAWSKENGRSEHQGYFAVKDGRVEFLSKDRPFIARKTFQEYQLSVQADRSGLTLRHSPTKTQYPLSLPHTEDFGDWESVNIDRYGWLFAEGYGNDYAIKLNVDEGLAVDRIHRFTGRGWFARFIEWIFGIGPASNISSTQWSSQCVDYSPVLRLTLFCDPAKVLRDGSLHDMPDHSGEIDRYVGDATHAKVALLKGQKGQLFALDGDHIELLAEDLGRYIKVHDVPEVGRTFVGGKNGILEVIGSFPDLRLADVGKRDGSSASVSSPHNSNGPFQFMDFVRFPGSNDVLGFGANASVWRVGKNSNELIWQADRALLADYGRILRSEIAPVSMWDGVMFLMADNSANLITQCTE